MAEDPFDRRLRGLGAAYSDMMREASIEKCIRNIIDTQTRKMTEMDDTVKQLRLDEAELDNKIKRRK
jgi:hypothetical protein